MNGPLRVGVLGPVTAWVDGVPVPLGGPRQQAVLARLVVAGGRLVTTDRLVDDLWDEPPRGAVAAVRTFVADLRRRLEPGRAPRTPARHLVTDGPAHPLTDGRTA
ncbi:SARP family transcriptional regulator, partial [Promicromonospora citrea]|uniref:AfsR/SARP family transcriptional regulator n=1 Tax=Promicromonospora citrea TaxID=43677 RepID=UPI001487F91D